MKDPDRKQKQKRKPQAFGAPLREGAVGGTNRGPGQSAKMRRRRARQAKKARTATSRAGAIQIEQDAPDEGPGALAQALEFTRASDPEKPSGISRAIYREILHLLSRS